MDILKFIKDAIAKLRPEQTQKFGPIQTGKKWVADDIKRAILRHNMEDYFDRVMPESKQ